MDTDDDVSALEDEEEDVALLYHSDLTCELEINPQIHTEAASPSPCLSNYSRPQSNSITYSKEELLTSDSDEEDAGLPQALRRGACPYSVDHRKPNTIVRYVIHSARTQVTKDEKFVLYRVGIQQLVECRQDDDTVSYKPLQQPCAVFERRYSEFLAVYTALMDTHRSLMEEFEAFPKKVLIGNFSQEVIIERCKGFTRFLNYVHKEGVLSRTAVFSKFLYHPEVMTSNDYLLQSQFSEACPILENTYILLDSLQWDTGLILRILCQLIVCLYATSNYERSYNYAKVALGKFQSPTNRKFGKELYHPLLVFCDNLWGVLGKDKRAIRSKIEALHKRRHEEVTPNLLDVLRDDIALRTLH